MPLPAPWSVVRAYVLQRAVTGAAGHEAGTWCFKSPGRLCCKSRQVPCFLRQEHCSWCVPNAWRHTERLFWLQPSTPRVCRAEQGSIWVRTRCALNFRSQLWTWLSWVQNAEASGTRKQSSAKKKAWWSSGKGSSCWRRCNPRVSAPRCAFSRHGKGICTSSWHC